ncbi:MAG: RelA/SpoT family protein [Candidatus Magasanikbacteria bacterium]|nr:RelA/SpoT family protein [Candidatus Magasanikbacteria bacterium]
MPDRLKIPDNLSINDLVEKVKKYSTHKDLDLIWLAYETAKAAHAEQKRVSGAPYIIHPLAAAYILAGMRLDVQLVAAALLHDVPEDTNVTIEEIEKDFGKDIAGMVSGITKLGKLKYRGMERYMENLRKMFVAMAEDVRVMIIKFADRVHNLTTLSALPEDKRYRIALESLEIYAPIANRLGMGEFRGLLEDLSFPYVFPKEYQKVKEIQDRMFTEGETLIEKILTMLRKELKESQVKLIDLHGRRKQLYSFYQKLLRKGWDSDKVYDVIALRVILKDVSDCYATLGIIHKLWRPLKGRIKDYIAQPKPNGYQSLHTTVFYDEGKIVEFQIRTQEMHNDAEFGVAAHWHYDEFGIKQPAKNIRWAEDLAAIQKEVLNNVGDLEQLKIDFFKNRIFVFTPKGDVIDLPEDATPVDFAYHIHTEIGNRCSGVKINDSLASLSTPLKSGDVIEIIIDKNRKTPSQDWIKFVKTHLARNHIKNALKTAEHDSWLKFVLPKRKQRI